MNFKTCCTYCMFIGGTIFLITSMVILVIWPYLFNKIINEQLILTPTSESYELWHDIPLPMFLELSLFNFTNTEEVAANRSVKPNLQELGPYVFRERSLKVNVSWYDHNSTVTYFQNKTWQFEPGMSNGSLSDEVTNINVVLATVAFQLKGTSSIWMSILNSLFNSMNQNIFITKTAGELLFDGYDDELIDLAKNFSSINIPIPINIDDIDIPFDKFGWFYGRNGSATYEGEYNMFTGMSDITKLGQLHTWNRKNITDFYRDGCNIVNGTTGDLWPPRTEADNATLFVSDVCGTLLLKNGGKRNVDGVSGTMFIGDDSVFDNGWNYPEKACYCPEDRSLCLPPGVLDVSKCQFGAPAYISYPHFYLANETYLNAVDGLVPNREDDEFRLVLEETLGIPLAVRAQLQINIRIEHIPGFNIINNRMPEILVPMLWFRQEVRLTDEYANLAKLVVNVDKGIDILLYCILSISIVAILTAIGLFALRRLRQDPERQLLVSEND